MEKMQGKRKKTIIINDEGSIEEFTTCTEKAIVFHVLNPKKQWMENRIGFLGPCRIGDTPIFIDDDNGQTHIVYGIECFWKPFNEDRMELTDKEKEYWSNEKKINIKAGEQLREFAKAMKTAKNREDYINALKIIED
jgi:hypothetical protein